MRKRGYDFMSYTSFPSSAKLYNDEPGQCSWWGFIFEELAAVPGATFQFKAKVKQQCSLPDRTWVSAIPATYWNGKEWRYLPWVGSTLVTPNESFDWTEISSILGTLPDDAIILRTSPCCGEGTLEMPSITWYDDIEVYINGKLAFKEEFSPPMFPMKPTEGPPLPRFLKIYWPRLR